MITYDLFNLGSLLLILGEEKHAQHGELRKRAHWTLKQRRGLQEVRQACLPPPIAPRHLPSSLPAPASPPLGTGSFSLQLYQTEIPEKSKAEFRCILRTFLFNDNFKSGALLLAQVPKSVFPGSIQSFPRVLSTRLLAITWAIYYVMGARIFAEMTKKCKFIKQTDQKVWLAIKHLGQMLLTLIKA